MTGAQTMANTDRELLELAAKAADIDYWRMTLSGAALNDEETLRWNPLIDDRDAFRLAVKLHISVRFCWDGCDDQYDTVIAEKSRIHADEQIGFDMKATQFDEPAATRRAIVRAAAAIAKQGGNHG